MTRIISIKKASSLVVATAVALTLVGLPMANAATKSITCYKATASKVVKAASPKCPTGWSLTKPKAKKPAPVKGTTKSQSINASYTGKIAMVWSDSDVQATSVTATGTGTTLGLTQLVGSGSSAPSGQDATISGTGYLSDGTNTLKATFDPSATAHAKEGAAPTNVTITGTATITGGTGKFAGATGTLKFTGGFPVAATSAGTKDSGALTITITGIVNTK